MCGVASRYPTNRCYTCLPRLASRIDYGNAVLYGISDRLLHRLDMVQRSAARVVLRIRHTAALKQLHWLPVKWRVEYKLLVLVFRALHDQTPAYLASLITPYWSDTVDTVAVHSPVRGRPCGTRFPRTYA